MRADISANDFQIRATGNKLVEQGKLEFGADINGRAVSKRTTSSFSTTWPATSSPSTDNLSIDSASRIDTGFFFQGERPLGAHFSAPAASASTTSATSTTAATSATAR